MCYTFFNSYFFVSMVCIVKAGICYLHIHTLIKITVQLTYKFRTTINGIVEQTIFWDEHCSTYEKSFGLFAVLILYDWRPPWHARFTF